MSYRDLRTLNMINMCLGAGSIILMACWALSDSWLYFAMSGFCLALHMPLNQILGRERRRQGVEDNS